MSDFVVLAANASLWDPVTKAMCGLHDFCPMLTTFHMWVIRQAQLITLSQVGSWGNMEKTRQDMAFLLVAPSITTGCERVFGLTMVWTHPHQAYFPNLLKVAHKLVLLADISEDWSYAFVQLNDVVVYIPLSKEGHVNTMMDGMPSTDTDGWLCQLQISSCCSMESR